MAQQDARHSARCLSRRSASASAGEKMYASGSIFRYGRTTSCASALR
jgi:hypothetical protein